MIKGQNGENLRGCFFSRLRDIRPHQPFMLRLIVGDGSMAAAIDSWQPSLD